MTPLNIIFSLIILLISGFLCVQLLKLYKRFKLASDNTTATNIYVIKCNDSVDEDICLETMTIAEPPPPRPEGLKGMERRRYPRNEFHDFVEFINKGALYKEKARDLSYSGIFIQSKTPEKYKKNDVIVMTFQTDESGPQRRKGRIVRTTHAGIGVNFVC
ncbi:PilZ domain-containing protein [Desulfobacter latus]|uniref:PilZ domain-containing protein n=1 Tax=Desulfobacter latus TaxID=2292 RepID=A0A850SVY3_9BACT|nr:PilZ domain-containing protein [Desulfobacter latus]NWH05309.1 PilZ domain-containing protein [Desulfobacter latus]